MEQYKSVDMYGPPVKRRDLPPEAIILRSLWCYAIKSDGRKKARNVCDGQPKRTKDGFKKITLAETYAASLSQTEMRIFWCLTAAHNWIAIGADATNAYAHSPPPRGECYMQADAQYVEWYNTTQRADGEPKIDTSYVFPVQHALQGHPESPRLWETYVNGKLDSMGFKNTPHAPCLYTGTWDNKPVLILRQVDDFAVSCADRKTAESLYEELKELCPFVVEKEEVRQIYGIDIAQTRDYIQVSCETYLAAIQRDYDWLNEDITDAPVAPVPEELAKQLDQKDNDAATTTLQLERQYGFKYRSLLGKLMFAMVCGRFDLSYYMSKLSRASKEPRQKHFEALKSVTRYAMKTRHRGIIYWRPRPREDLPAKPLPVQKPDHVEPNDPWNPDIELTAYQVKRNKTKVTRCEMDSLELAHHQMIQRTIGDTLHGLSPTRIMQPMPTTDALTPEQPSS